MALRTGHLSRAVLVLLAGFAASASAAPAGGVAYIDPQDRFFIVDIVGMKDVQKGTNLCILDENGSVVSCGAVLVSNKTKAGLRLPPSEMKKIKLGGKMSVKPIYLKDDGAPASDKSAAPFRVARTKADAQTTAITKEAERKDSEIAAKEAKARAQAKANPKEAERQEAERKEAERKAAEAAAKAASADGNAAAGSGKGAGGAPGTSPAGGDAAEGFEDNAAASVPEAEAGSDAATALPDAKKTAAAGSGKPVTPAAESPPYRAPLTATRLELMGSLFSRPLVNVNYLSLATIKDAGAESGTLWQRNSRARPPLGSTVGALVRLSLLKNYGFAAGVRFRRDEKAAYQQPMDAAFPALFSTTSTKVTDSGLWLEGTRTLRTSRFTWNQFGLGADVETSDVSMKTVRGALPGETSGEIIAVARSRLSVVSLRAEATQDVAWGHAGLSLGLALLKPVKKFAASFESSVVTPKNVTLTSNPDEDLRGSLGHDTASYGLDLHLALYTKF